ncbi:hypothetical protein C2G38_2186254 [Gigaspora rosea]|uniref:Uncharacterized protein n=1 Tax=Gigaspora rosea TaxID=44941 RepID=A0A397VA81_9GLOM|nr:hypothetical protein C2G38_2186254 [Gigaspora rosea]
MHLQNIERAFSTNNILQNRTKHAFREVLHLWKLHLWRSDYTIFRVLMGGFGLYLGLINKCLDAEPKDRPTTRELANILNHFLQDLKSKTTELYKQVKDLTQIF